MPSERPLISAIVITKNESEKIGDCLASLQWADEVVVVDDFSCDATPEICRRYGVTFQQNHFTGFMDQKSYAMSLTSHDWVLALDADERVSEQMRESILSLTNEDTNRYSCFKFRCLTRFWGKWIRHASLYPDYKGRLFNKHRGCWGDTNIHERFITSGPTRKLRGDILHVQDRDILSYISRTVRYSHMSAEELYRKGKAVHWYDLTIRPIYTFCYRYFFRFGFLCGLEGFIISFIGSVGTFIKYSKLYELYREEKR